MKVLRVFWIQKKYQGLTENRKDPTRVDVRYKTSQKQTDFQHDINVNAAIESIYDEHGRPPIGLSLVSPIPPKEWAEYVSHKIVDLVHEEKIHIKSEKYFEQPLFDGVTWSETMGKK